MKQAENPLLVDLALQGGGSHGAFTWVYWIVSSKNLDCVSRQSPGHQRAR